jgi:hypothetical protein
LERVDIAVHLCIDLGNSGVECINVAQMQAQQEAVSFGDAALEGLRHKAGADQAVCQQIGKPDCIGDIGLASRHVLDMRGFPTRVRDSRSYDVSCQATRALLNWTSGARLHQVRRVNAIDSYPVGRTDPGALCTARKRRRNGIQLRVSGIDPNGYTITRSPRTSRD